MLKLDTNLLAELGLGALDPESKKALLEHMYSTLELRVGELLMSTLSDASVAEFEELMEAGDEEATLAWLEATCPDYREAVNAVFADLKAEITGSAAAILAAEPDAGS
ncbi:hypothetical protein GCM10009804_34440 [Kribbella hippodromi]|uniref:Uncharacterized protein n=1 Tax=Kribbella hippodromi TaxID=434347 RepID=A0ABP4PBS2_9ACTN